MQQDDLSNDDESLIINIDSHHPILPEGKYKFIEYYCSYRNCDCNSGAFLMTKLDAEGKETPNRVALMDYTWNQPISIDNPSLGLGHESMDAKFVEAGLEEFKKLLTNDSNTLIKIKKGYAQTREDFKNHPEYQYNPATIKKNTNKIGRNDPCPCGSGKKYKKCCL